VNALLNRVLFDQKSRALFGRFSFWLVIALAAFLRLFNLGYPGKLVFDETYYVKDAWTLWNTGAERSWPQSADAAFEAGHVNGWLADGSFVVHPPLGKWIIGLGMWLFGAQNSFSWRIMVALLSIASVALIMVIAKQLFKSTLWPLVAGFMLAVDGHAIVLGRTALLDGILMFFALLGFFFVLKDQATRDVEAITWRRPWLVYAGLALGAATAVKWSGLYFLAAFGLYVVISDALARRRLNSEPYQIPETAELAPNLTAFSLALLVSKFFRAVVVFLLMVPIAAVTYLASWTGWLTSTGGYDRDSNTNPFLALLKYHQDAYNFHVNLHTPHAYASNPLTWLFDIRPTSFFYEGLSYGQNGCTALDGCSSAITPLGNPFIWLPAAAAVFFLTYLLFTRRDKMAGTILIGIAGGYLPWLAFMNRTVFQFYSIAFLPWMILALVYALSLFIRSRSAEQRLNAIRGVLSYLVVVAAASLFFLPIWIGTWIPYWYWHIHMWIPSWI
jgi:dolichyl-phosphate-mannose--protein O-mannosyl transferase